MSLFSKEKCVVCGNSVNPLSKTAVSGGFICTACRIECRKNFVKNIEYRTADEIREHIDFLKQNRAAFKAFTPTDSVKKVFFIDRKSRRFYADTGLESWPPIVYPFDAVSSYELVVDGEAYLKGGVKVGRALVGGAVLGPAGMVLGGLSGKKKQQEMVSKMAVRILLSNQYEAYEEITFISSPVEKGGYEFSTAEKDATTVLSLLDTVVAGAKPAPSTASGSAADELLKYKQLLDCGAITEEEFRKKKAELL